MKFPIALLLSLACGRLSGQPLIMDLVDPQFQNQSLLYSQAKESPSLKFKNFLQSRITTKDGLSVDSLLLNIELKNNTLIVLYLDLVLVLDPKQIESFSVLADEGERVFEKIRANTFYERLFKGEYSLYKEEEISTLPTQQAQNTGYHDDSAKPKTRIVEHYYILKGPRLEKLNFNKKWMLKFFENETIIFDFISKKRIKDEKDLIDALNFYEANRN